jgi:hypothetical protein
MILRISWKLKVVKVILSIGSPPKKNLYTLGNDESLSGVSLIENLYEPKMEK